MDLYNDLPKSSSNSKGESHPIRHQQPFLKQTSASLFDDLPETSSEKVKERETEKRKTELDAGESPPIKKPAPDDSDTYHLKAYVAERKGEREEMQDAHVILDNIAGDVSGLDPSIFRLGYFAVFDGHAGCRSSTFASKNLHTTICANFPKGNISKVESEIKKCLVDSYKKTDDTFLKQAKKAKPTWKDGSTATTFLVINNTIYIANLGDSKAILCRFNECDGPNGKYSGIPLTKDHNPSDYTERIRIQKAGGNVRDGRVMGQLEVSRSLGDGPYKNHGVSCIPDIKRCQLTPADRWLMIACDGLWKAFTVDKVIEFINQVLQDETIEGSEYKSAEELRWETAVTKITNEAVRRLTADNVTVLLIKISPPSSQMCTEKEAVEENK